MERSYKHIGLLFWTVLLVVALGFWKTYFGLFPGFVGVPISWHFHAAMLLLWFAMLIAQPVLIRARRFAMHRLLGRLSFGLVPLVVLSMLVVTRGQFVRFAGVVSARQNLADLFIPLTQTLLFAAFYGLAMAHRRQPKVHLRYVVASSLVFLSPALGRLPALWSGASFSTDSIIVSFLVPDVVLLALIGFDLRGGQDKHSRPYVVSLALLLVSHLGWYFLPDRAAWQAVAQGLVQAFL